MFRAMHPDYHGSKGVQFRLRLLKFTIIFTKRAAPAETTPSVLELQKLRDRRQEQAQSFRSRDEDSMKLGLPELSEYLEPPNNLQIKPERFPHQETNSFGPDSAASCRPTPPAISLLVTLPFFMALSAAHNDMMDEARITRVWMLLAAGYMAQAAMEQYLLYGTQRSEVLREAFAWGFDTECGAHPGSDQWRINAMFWGDDEVVLGWDTIRDDHWQAVRSLDPRPCSLFTHVLMTLSSFHPKALTCRSIFEI